MRRLAVAAALLVLCTTAAADARSEILPHPAGCPRVLFCGCGASVDRFGAPRRDLYRAAAWLRFRRSSPAPNNAAVRPGHVFILKEHVQGDIWLVYDANSGGGKTRLHHRSIRGYVIVDPES